MIFSREQLEERERKTLAPYGMKSGESRGREYPEKEPDHRTVFQRDRDRILHTTAFRRLEYKTQVFVNYEGDYFRTRLTHTLEVSQIGRSIARTLGANEDLVEAICLVHDIGHPPFGHSGEQALARQMQDFGGFDHNRQALRIVTQLERRHADFPGLNLTYETREGIVKHETQYDISSAEGYEPEKRGGLEAQIANIADELAYTAHDLDDGLYSTLLIPSQLDGVDLWELGRKDVGFKRGKLNEIDRHLLISHLIGMLISDVCHATQERLAKARPRSVEDIQQLDHDLISHSGEMAKMVGELKDFLYENMYRHYRVVRMQQKAQRFISRIFEAYMDDAKQLPHSVQPPPTVPQETLARAVCDYIAGMTDRYALAEYQKLFDPYTRP